MTDPIPPTPAEPAIPTEKPAPAFQPETNPTPVEQPTFDPPANPGDWRPHDRNYTPNG
jgi:hypothetical protein